MQTKPILDKLAGLVELHVNDEDTRRRLISDVQELLPSIIQEVEKDIRVEVLVELYKRLGRLVEPPSIGNLREMLDSLKEESK